MEFLSARRLPNTAAVLSLIFLALPSFTCVSDPDYACNSDTAGGLCALESSGACVRHTTSTNNHISAGHISDDGGCVSNQEAKQLRDSVGETQASPAIDSVQEECSWDQHQSLHLPFGLCCTIGPNAQIRYGTCLELGAVASAPHHRRSATTSSHAVVTVGIVVAMGGGASGYCCLPSSVFLGVDGVRG